jgi:hypothetical protein
VYSYSFFARLLILCISLGLANCSGKRSRKALEEPKPNTEQEESNVMPEVLPSGSETPSDFDPTGIEDPVDPAEPADSANAVDDDDQGAFGADDQPVNTGTGTGGVGTGGIGTGTGNTNAGTNTGTKPVINNNVQNPNTIPQNNDENEKKLKLWTEVSDQFDGMEIELKDLKVVGGQNP